MLQFFALSESVCCLRPWLRLSFFAVSQNLNVNGTPNVRTVRQILKRADTAGFRQRSCTAQRTFQVGLLTIKFREPNFLATWGKKI